MNYLKIVFISFCMANLLGCAKQQPTDKPEAKMQWYKGNLHTHSYWSDGDEFPEVIMDWYKSNGYHFVALSDHNILAEGEKWISIREDSLYQNAFQNYLEQYGRNWVSHRIDTGTTMVKLKTYKEYKDLFEEENEFLIIQSEEITDQFDDHPLHMNATNIQSLIEPQGGNNVAEVLQNNIDAVLSQREATGVPIIPHINHPNFGYAITVDDMISLDGERFFEVYNGHHMVHNTGDSIHISTENMWDLINISYLNNDKPLMYGLATDDSHNYHVMGSEWSNAGRGWIMVQADTLSAEALIASMEAGRFYATTGVRLSNLDFDNNKLSIEVAADPGINHTISFIGYKKGGMEAEEFKSMEGNTASFELTEEVLFVRARITSSRLHSNPIENLVHEMAWTQPVVNDL